MLVERKEPHQLWAEAIRDVGILFFVFGPLDTILKGDEGQNWLLASLIAFLGILLVTEGVRKESEQ